MTELEQLKNEYKNLPVPADGPQQMLQSIARAKRTRHQNRRRHITLCVVAAAMIALVVVPASGILLLSGVTGKDAENAVMMDVMVKTEESSCADTGGMLYKENSDYNESQNMAPECPQMDAATGAVEEDVYEMGKRFFTESEQKRISGEILRQMKEQMENQGMLYYIKSEEYPEGFEQITEEQAYYINGEAQLVIVFEAGEVAPIVSGKVEFVIPPEVVSP